VNIQLTNTTKIVELATPSGVVPARIWEGHTESGIPVHAYITRIAVAKDQDASQFERELQECQAPSTALAAIPARLVIA
jgi:hypothetical protein